MKIHVRAPATTANLGPGFDGAARALDLWNELEVARGKRAAGRRDASRRACVRRASPRRRLVVHVHRPDPARARARLERRSRRARPRRGRDRGRRWIPTPTSCSPWASTLEGHADNLAAALVGGVCLTWDGQIARIADDVPAARSPSSRRTRVKTAEARAASAADSAARRRRLQRRPRDAARRRARLGQRELSSPRPPTTACTSRIARRSAPHLEAIRSRPAGRLRSARRSPAPGRR